MDEPTVNSPPSTTDRQPFGGALDWQGVVDENGRVLPHRYVFDMMAMGDCRRCGHVEDSPLHI